MAKKATARKSAKTSRRTTTRAAKRATSRKTSGKSNLKRLLDSGALDAFAARGLDPEAREHIEALSAAEVNALIKAHLKVSPNKPWQPDPDGSIF